MRPAAAILTLLVMAISWPGTGFSQDEAAQAPAQIRVGVRTDAPPFSYHVGRQLLGPERPSGPLGQQGFSGYMVFICDRVLETMIDRQFLNGAEIAPVDVTATDRFVALRAGPDAPKQIDILCDPSTITRERLREFVASPPLYLSGIGFASQPRSKLGAGTCASRIGLVDSTTALYSGVVAILQGDEWISYRDELMRFIHNPAGFSISEEADCQRMPIATYADHNLLAEAFCRGEVQYYVGDMEIVNRSLEAYGNCDFRKSSVTYTDDRYVIFQRVVEPDEGGKARLMMEFSRTLSELILANPSLLDEAFEANFPGYQASDKLRFFLWSMRGP